MSAEITPNETSLKYRKWTDGQRRSEAFREEYWDRIEAIPNLTKEEELDLFYKYQTNHDLEARNKIVEAYLKLALHLAMSYISKDKSTALYFEQLETALQNGILGLFDAVSKFDVSNGASFATYAGWWIRSRIIEGEGERSLTSRRKTHYRRELFKKLKHYIEIDPKVSIQQLSELTGSKPATILDTLLIFNPEMSPLLLLDDLSVIENEIDTYSMSGENMNIHNKVEYEEMVEDVHEAINKLDFPEQTIVKKRLMQAKPTSLRDIADILKTTKSDVSRREKKSVEFLRVELDDYADWGSN